MKRLLTTILLFCLTPIAWGETLALTVHNDNGDPGEARSVWTETYYADDQGRLVRIHRTVQASFVGDPDIEEDIGYHWEAGRVWWETQSPDRVERREMRFEGDNLRLHWKVESTRPGQTDYTGDRSIQLKRGTGVQWEDDRYQYAWFDESGYSQKVLPSNFSPPLGDTEYTTSGSRLTRWFRGREDQTIILDRTPRQLVGTYVTMNERLDGWISTGKITISGPGLWSRDRFLNWVNALLVQDPVYFPFVFVERYLR